jgi:DNA-binding response OmpR family regulator
MAAIIFLDQDLMARAILSTLLKAYGHDVYQAADGGAAIRAFERVRGKINILIAPRLLPDTTGVELATYLQTCRPNLNVILILDRYQETCRLCDRWQSVRKPYTALKIMEHVQFALRHVEFSH